MSVPPASPNQAPHAFVAEGRPVGFLTDPTLCIGCKACEVACKEWNQVPEDGLDFKGRSYDHTGALGASTWRHVKFLELDRPRGLQRAGPMAGLLEEALRDSGEEVPAPAEEPFSWLFLSDVCKHCEEAGCLEACPTGAIVRTEVASVLVQDDICNGCGYCVVGCPFGVIDRRPEPLAGAGGAFKCTFCYDRQAAGLTPACAKVCPTESILFGPLEEIEERGVSRLEEVRRRGFDDASLYRADEGSVAGVHARFLLVGEARLYGLPEAPEAPTLYLKGAWTSALLSSLALLILTLWMFIP